MKQSDWSATIVPRVALRQKVGVGTKIVDQVQISNLKKKKKSGRPSHPKHLGFLKFPVVIHALGLIVLHSVELWIWQLITLLKMLF